MGFEQQILTLSGVAFIRDIKEASDKIVFTRARSGSQWDSERGDLAAKPLDWYDGVDGSISAVSVAGGILSVIASFSGSGSAPIKSVCICAQKKKNGVSPTYDKKDDVIIAATCDDNSCYVSGDSFQIRFDLPIALSGVVDPVGSVDPANMMTTDTEQNIEADKTFLDCNLSVSEDGGGSVDISSNQVAIRDSDGDNIFSIDDESIGIGEEYYEYSTLPVKVEYNTTAGTVTLTLGSGTAITLTCTSVVEAE